MTTDVLAGNPTALAQRADGYARSASAILEAAEALRDLARSQNSQATDALEARAGELAGDLRGAHDRYVGTAGALRDYAVTLDALQRRAEGALADAAAAQRSYDRLDTERRTLERRVDQYQTQGVPSATTALVEQDLAGVLARRRGVVGALDDADAAMRAIRDEFESAARAAISRIDSAIDGGDGFWDHVGSVLEGIGGVLAAIGDWVSGFLDGLLSALIDILAFVLTIVIVVLILAVALLAIGATIATAPLTSLAVLLVAGVAIIALVVSLALVRAVSDTLKPTPDVAEFTPPDPSDDRGPLSSAFDSSTEVDNLGNDPAGGPEAQGVVKVVRVVGPDGRISWRVTLPSTQDWVLGPGYLTAGDGPASNDLDSNIALMMTPSMRTQYERAVMEALQQAGVRPGPDGDPVMLVGFSQGGIMAAHLAANRPDSYNYRAVLVAGAPVDHMNIPPRTTVVSLQHEGDIVHELDEMTFQGGARNTDHWLTLSAPAADPSQAHSALQYDLTLEDRMNDVTSFAPQFEDFFIETEAGAARDGSSVHTKYYAWRE